MFAIFLIGEGGMSDHVELYFRLRIRVGIKHFLVYYHTERILKHIIQVCTSIHLLVVQNLTKRRARALIEQWHE